MLTRVGSSGSVSGSTGVGFCANLSCGIGALPAGPKAVRHRLARKPFNQVIVLACALLMVLVSVVVVPAVQRRTDTKMLLSGVASWRLARCSLFATQGLWCHRAKCHLLLAVARLMVSATVALVFLMCIAVRLPIFRSTIRYLFAPQSVGWNEDDLRRFFG